MQLLPIPSSTPSPQGPGNHHSAVAMHLPILDISYNHNMWHFVSDSLSIIVFLFVYLLFLFLFQPFDVSGSHGEA